MLQNRGKFSDRCKQTIAVRFSAGRRCVQDPTKGGGGAGGIRTLDTLLAYTHFPGERLRPLGHRSAISLEGRPSKGARTSRQGCCPSALPCTAARSSRNGRRPATVSSGSYRTS